jgi:hypothetical protein
MTALKRISHWFVRVAHLAWLAFFPYGFFPAPIMRLMSSDRPPAEWRLNVVMTVLPLFWFAAAIALFLHHRWAWVTSFLCLLTLTVFLLVRLPHLKSGWWLSHTITLLVLLWLTRREYFLRSHEAAA